MCAFSPQPITRLGCLSSVPKWKDMMERYAAAVGTWGRKQSSEGCCVSAIPQLALLPFRHDPRQRLRPDAFSANRPQIMSPYSAPPPCAQPQPAPDVPCLDTCLVCSKPRVCMWLSGWWPVSPFGHSNVTPRSLSPAPSPISARNRLSACASYKCGRTNNMPAKSFPPRIYTKMQMSRK